jgi:hypothetical protein
VPGAIVGEAVKKKVPEDKLPLLVSPAGRVEMLQETAPANPPMGVAVAVKVPVVPPCRIDCELGDTDTLKSGWDA